jgi:AraC-like DNA-binding protein
VSGSSEYAERPVAHPYVMCRWEQRIAGDVDEYVQRVLPDACADLIVWPDGTANVVGPATSVHLERLPGGGNIRGLRLRTAAIGTALGLPADELRDQEVPLDALFGGAAEQVAEQIWAGDLPAFPAEEQRDRRVEYALGALARPGARVAAVAEDVGTSERHLRRLLLAHTGLEPRTVLRVARFQRFLRLSGRPESPLALLAAEAGYADQAHLSHEVRALSGLTPSALLSERRAAQA